MRTYQLLISLFLLGVVACEKDPPTFCGAGYEPATVVSGRNGCEQTGFLLKLDSGLTLPPDSLPASFQQSGLRVCVAYRTYEDLRMCACCGGTRLRIQHIQRQ